MRSIFQLVDDVVNGVLSQWIDAKSLAKLDSACCNQIERICFLKMLSESQFTLPNDDYFTSVYYLSITWCIIRKIKLRSLKIDMRLFSVVGISELIFGSVIKLLIMLEYYATETAAKQSLFIINRCVNLRELYMIQTCKNWQYEYFPHMNATILNRLEVLRWTCLVSKGISANSMLRLTEHCALVVELDLRVLNDALTALKQLICNNSQTLQRISVCFHNSVNTDDVHSIIIIPIAQHCQFFQHFKINEIPKL